MNQIPRSHSLIDIKISLFQVKIVTEVDEFL
jgi:hypothetical protein